MKAFLLAAGVGSRLRPLTDRVPKCLVPIGGEPILGIWLRRLAALGVREALLNTHHLPDVVGAYIASRPVPGIRVTLFHEPVLLGSAGTVRANRAFAGTDPELLIVYADNLTNVDLARFAAFHRAAASPFTVGLFRTPEPRQCGIASLDVAGRITEFVEKPAEPKGNLANAGLYLAGPSVFDFIPDQPYTDFGFDVLPRLTGRMYGYPITEYFCDIGTPERLERALRDWAAIPAEQR